MANIVLSIEALQPQSWIMDNPPLELFGVHLLLIVLGVAMAYFL